MTKKVSVLLTFALMLSLCGCQLAKGEELVENGYSMTDKLIGVFITEEYLDLFDMEAYLNDNLNQIMSGKEIGFGEQAEYEGRIYATPQGFLEDGSPDGYFTFEGVEGYAYFFPEVETETYSAMVSNVDPCFSNINNSTHLKDDNVREVITEGVLNVVGDVPDVVFYMNPVYQDKNGYVYIVAGTGVGASNGLQGAAMTDSMTTETKTIVDGKEMTEKYSVKITYQGVPRPQTIVVLQMSADSVCLHREEYLPGQLPEQIDPVEGADYIIVETVTREKTIREVFSQEDRWLDTFDPQESGVCTKQQTELLWKDWEA